MKNQIVHKEFVLETTPLEKIHIEDSTITIECDDQFQETYILEFSPYQAIKIVTIDCANFENYECNDCLYKGRFHRHIVEVLDSKWIRELKRDLKKFDKQATFMNEAKHYVFLAGDNYIEIVSWEMTIRKK